MVEMLKNSIKLETKQQNFGIPEKEIVPKNDDLGFKNETWSYFNKQVESENSQINESNSDDDNEFNKTSALRYREFGEKLSELGNTRKIEQLRENPEDFCESILVLAGDNEVAKEALEIPDLPPDLLKSFESKMNESKKLFVESCKKLFPDIKLPPSHLQDRMIDRMLSDLESNNSENTPAVSQLSQGLKHIKENYKLSQAYNPKELLNDLNKVVHNIPSGARDLILARESFFFGEEKAVVSSVKTLYQLGLITDDIERKVYGSADKTSAEKSQIDKIRAELKSPKPSPPKTPVASSEKTGVMSPEEMAAAKARAEKININSGFKEKKIIDLPFNEVRDSLNSFDEKGKSVADIIKLMTPEVKKSLLNHWLENVDGRINSAKRLDYSRTKGQILGAATVGLVMGLSAEHKVYHLPLIAAEGKFIDSSSIPKMKVADYIKKAFGYDLRNDPLRREELLERTNMLD